MLEIKSSMTQYIRSVVMRHHTNDIINSFVIRLSKNKKLYIIKKINVKPLKYNINVSITLND